MCTMVLKETLSYYVHNSSFTFCTFLDATKAFDRVNYCKLFNLLIKRGISASFLRVLITLYTRHCFRVVWAGFASTYFTAINGVKQGGVLSPILFCIYIDDLLLKLSQCGVGCFIGTSFVGALAYADDIVLLAPSPCAMRKLLAICESYALDYDVKFNASKSNFIIFTPSEKRNLAPQMNTCKFSIGGNPVVRVESYVHLGHIINCHLNDSDDVLHRRNCFIGQSNNLLCFFDKFNMSVKVNLFKSFCSSIYGCELWSLTDGVIDMFCTAWRRVLRRLLNLPYTAHSYLLPLMTDTLPVFDEICRRFAKFFLSCLNSNSSLVKSVARHGVDVARYNSCVGRNVLFCCKYFNWRLSDFLGGHVSLNYTCFRKVCISEFSSSELNIANSLYEALLVNNGDLFIDNFNRDEVDSIIVAMSTS